MHTNMGTVQHVGDKTIVGYGHQVGDVIKPEDNMLAVAADLAERICYLVAFDSANYAIQRS